MCLNNSLAFRVCFQDLKSEKTLLGSFEEALCSDKCAPEEQREGVSSGKWGMKKRHHAKKI